MTEKNNKEKKQDSSKQPQAFYKKWQFWVAISGVAVAIVISILLVILITQQGGGPQKLARCQAGETYAASDGVKHVSYDIPAGTYYVTVPGHNNSARVNGFKTEEEATPINYNYVENYNLSSEKSKEENTITLTDDLWYVVIDADGTLQLECK